MINKIKKTVEQQKILIANFSYLAILNVFNMVLPLITYPYLIRVLGKETYGLIVFAQVMMTLFAILIDFGFNISATKQISINRDDPLKLSEIVSSVLIIKIIIGLFSFLILIGLIFLIPSFFEYRLLYIFSFGICLNEIFFSQFFFQGIEQMKYITIISVISRLLFILFVFILIKNKSDYLLVPILNVCGALLNGVFSFLIIFKIKKLKIYIPTKSMIVLHFQEALPLFWSRLVSKVKDQSNVILIGASIGMKEVAYYDLVSKLINIANSFIETVIIAIFPKLSLSKNIALARKFFGLTLLLVFITYLFFVLFGKYIILILAGKTMLKAVDLFPFLGFMLLRSSSYFIGNIVLIVNNKTKPYVNSLFLSGLSYFICVGIIYLTKLPFTIELFIYVSMFSLFLEYSYRIYACKRYKLLNWLVMLKN